MLHVSPRWVGAVAVTVALGTVSGACGGESGPETPEAPMTISLTSPEFGEGATIPRRFTCDGGDVSPPLEFANVPAEATELTLLVEDPDAPRGTFVHWVLWGIEPGTSSLGAGEVPRSAAQGKNDFGGQGYAGPCPPPGDPHRYIFTVFAVAERLDLSAGASANDLRRALAGTVLASGSLMGRYGR
jgi:Raf kinase inhibitor-like YbhB/YbcL family protein